MSDLDPELASYLVGLDPELASWLVVSGYGSIKEWAEENGYYMHPESVEWYREDDPQGWPGPEPVDIEAEIAKAMRDDQST